MFKFKFDENEFIAEMQVNLRKNAQQNLSLQDRNMKTFKKVAYYCDKFEVLKKYAEAESMTYLLEVMASDMTRAQDISHAAAYISFLEGPDSLTKRLGLTPHKVYTDFKVASRVVLEMKHLNKLDPEYHESARALFSILKRYVSAVNMPAGKEIKNEDGKVFSLDVISGALGIDNHTLTKILEHGHPSAFIGRSKIVDNKSEQAPSSKEFTEFDDLKDSLSKAFDEQSARTPSVLPGKVNKHLKNLKQTGTLFDKKMYSDDISYADDPGIVVSEDGTSDLLDKKIY